MGRRAEILLALILASCGNSGATPARCRLPSTVTAENVGDAFASAAICATTACSPIADGILAEVKASPFGLESATGFALALDAGTLAIDVAHFGPCLAAFADGCNARSPFKLPVECRGVLEPKQPPGAICFSRYDCASSYCEVSSVPGCAGRCSGADGGCLFAADCGLWETCASGECGPGAAAGDRCAQDEDCAVNLVCVGNICTSPGQTAAICTEDAHCASGLFCRLGSPPDAGTCTAALGIGHACANSDSSLACGYGAYCKNVLTGNSSEAPTCAAYGAFGAKCSVGPVPLVGPTCESGLLCVDGGCVFPRQSGPCNLDVPDQCGFQDYCGGDNTCTPLRATGEACDPDAGAASEFGGCASGDCSDAGLCVPTGTFCPNVSGL